jgi:cytochrome c553
VVSIRRFLTLIIPALLLLAPTQAADFQHADAERGKGKSRACVACHNTDGNSPSGAFPKLAGQNERYLLRQMRAIRDGKYLVPVMAGQLDNMNEQDLQDIAAWYAEQSSTLEAAEPELSVRGEHIYRKGIKERDVPACIACHSPTGTGNYAAGYPRVSGQHAQYLLTRILGYRDGVGVYDDQSSIMRGVVEFMSREDMQAVAQYMAGLRP